MFGFCGRAGGSGFVRRGRMERTLVGGLVIVIARVWAAAVEVVGELGLEIWGLGLGKECMLQG